MDQEVKGLGCWALGIRAVLVSAGGERGVVPILLRVR